LEEIKDKISYGNELLRKGIHLTSVVIPILIYILEKELIVYITLTAASLMILFDLLRKVSSGFNKFYLMILHPVLRSRELDVKKHLFTGGTYYVIGIFLTVWIFPKEIAAVAILIMILCDTAAALIGKKFGKHKILNKTLEGSLSFLIIGIIIIAVTPRISQFPLEYLIAFIALILTTILELLPLKIDDNLSIPIFFSLVYVLLNKIILNI
jgi:dolichol kinase